MSRLIPELQTLMKWARKAPPVPPPSLPLGLATRIAARWAAAPPTSRVAIWQEAIWSSAWAATVIIVLGLAILTAEKLRTKSTYDFSPAYQIVAASLVP